MVAAPVADVELAVEWGQVVLLGAEQAQVNRAVRLLGRLGVPALTSRPRRDGSTTARTERDDWTITDVLDLTGDLRKMGLAVALRGGVISTDRARRQGAPTETDALRTTQRTVATFTFSDEATYSPQDADALAQRMGWARHGQQVRVQDRAGRLVALMLVTYEIDELLARGPWWPAEPSEDDLAGIAAAHTIAS